MTSDKTEELDPFIAPEQTKPLKDALRPKSPKGRLRLVWYTIITITLLYGWYGLIVDPSQDDIPIGLPRFDNGLARKPVMGWNTWNLFGCAINQTLILSSAKAIKNQGLDLLGYQYVLIDDCWEAPERVLGKLAADPITFSDGIHALSRQVHALGLKIGIYSSAGLYTCQHRPASLGFETFDAQTFADWEIDYLKYDNCWNENQTGSSAISFKRYATMAKALNETHRPIVYSLCQWGEDKVWEWGGRISNSFRMSLDINDTRASYLDILEQAAPIISYSRPGAFNDLDMLEVGNGGMTFNDYKSHFSLWSLLKSPLILGNDVTQMSPETKSIITNTDIIAINQDPLGKPALRMAKRQVKDGNVQWWQGPLSNNRRVVAALNASPTRINSKIDFKTLFKDSTIKTFQFFDLWDRARSIGSYTGSVEVEIEANGIRVFRVE